MYLELFSLYFYKLGLNLRLLEEVENTDYVPCENVVLRFGIDSLSYKNVTLRCWIDRLSYENVMLCYWINSICVMWQSDVALLNQQYICQVKMLFSFKNWIILSNDIISNFLLSTNAKYK